jgi:excisionase family DNA binding protein
MSMSTKRRSAVVSKRSPSAVSPDQSAATPAVASIEPLLVPLAEAARLLGVRIYSIRRLTRQGLLPFKVIGNRWLVNYSALKAYANSDKRAAA